MAALGFQAPVAGTLFLILKALPAPPLYGGPCFRQGLGVDLPALLLWTRCAVTAWPGTGPGPRLGHRAGADTKGVSLDLDAGQITN